MERLDLDVERRPAEQRHHHLWHPCVAARRAAGKAHAFRLPASLM